MTSSERSDPVVTACIEAIQERRPWLLIGSTEMKARTIALMREVFVTAPRREFLRPKAKR